MYIRVIHSRYLGGQERVTYGFLACFGRPWSHAQRRPQIAEAVVARDSALPMLSRRFAGEFSSIRRARYVDAGNARARLASAPSILTHTDPTPPPPCTLHRHP